MTDAAQTPGSSGRQGPLSGLRVVEFAGIGPAPFCAMLLSDLGADVVRIDRPGAGASRYDVTGRGRRALALDLKSSEAVETSLSLIAHADVLIEGFRPGVMERLGLGPEAALARNARLVYGRMTGWGQTGPLAQAAGHDINYIALSGALHAIGPADKPAIPLNLVGDFGGGALYLAFGLMAGVLQARESGRGQVVDAAMTDGAASLLAMFYGFRASGVWSGERGANLLDGGAHFYDTFRCSDGRWIAIGAIEPQFYALLLQKTGLDGDPAFAAQMDRSAWPALKTRLSARIALRTRAEWCEIMEGTDVCFAPVLDWDEAPAHPHNQARQAFVTINGVVQPAPAPHFSATPGAVQAGVVIAAQEAGSVLAQWSASAQDGPARQDA